MFVLQDINPFSFIFYICSNSIDLIFMIHTYYVKLILFSPYSMIFFHNKTKQTIIMKLVL
jgi:hypothetical protein